MTFLTFTVVTTTNPGSERMVCLVQVRFSQLLTHDLLIALAVLL